MKQVVWVVVIAALPAGVWGQRTQAEVYGEFRYAYGYVDVADTSHWAGVNNASRVGVRGETSGRGLTAFVDLQAGVSVDAEGAAFTQRYYLAGLRGGFGTLSIGRQSTAYKLAGLRLDPFYDTSTLSAGGAVPVTGLFAGASFGLSNLTNGWADRTIAYTSPSFGGFSANAAAFIDTEGDHDHGLGVGYQGRGLDAGVQYYSTVGGRTWAPAAAIDHAVRGHAGYTRVGSWSLGASWERLDGRDGGSQDFLHAAGTVNLTSRAVLAGAVGHVEDGAVQPTAGTAVHAGIFYAVLPQARVHALFSRLDAEGMPDRVTIALGLTYTFSVRP
jgi:predicted porin